MESSSKPLFMSWEEVLVSSEKGRRVVHYFLKGWDGRSDLAVIGKERSIRHMSYAVQSQFLRSLRPVSNLKWRTRREVIDWLSSLVQDKHSDGTSSPVDRFSDDEDAGPADTSSSKDLPSKKLGLPSKGFSWLGSAWTCRKRRRHYRSFCQNGNTVSVHNFVYVMTEENKRLVGYVEDLYADTRANNMVVVRWFNKIDEVGIVLPSYNNDREIFFSLCLQDLSVECIDGLATILSPHHFDKFQNEARHTLWEPYVCYRQIDNEDVKPFDITQVQGYWNQELLRYMYTSSPKHGLKATEGDGDSVAVFQSRPKRNHGSKMVDMDRQRYRDDVIEEIAMDNIDVFNKSAVSTEGRIPNGGPAALHKKEVVKQKSQQPLCVGCHVEVLSQDSGIKGCWFRGVVVKRSQSKVKVRYQDVQDADDETGNLEEWLPASRIAVPDILSVRSLGRTTVRPCPPSKSRGVSWAIDVGTSVDAWWYDGWWEGIVIHRESDDKIYVYFPGEQKISIFGCSDLRHSQDWIGNKWKYIKERPDLVSSLLSNQVVKTDGSLALQVMVVSEGKQTGNDTHVTRLAPKDKEASCKSSSPSWESPLETSKVVAGVLNLAKDNSLAQLKWSSSKKRRRGRGEGLAKGGLNLKRLCNGLGIGSSGSGSPEAVESSRCERFSISKPLKVDRENCKYGGDSLFISSSVPPLSSLVMSR